MNVSYGTYQGNPIAKALCQRSLHLNSALCLIVWVWQAYWGILVVTRKLILLSSVYVPWTTPKNVFRLSGRPWIRGVNLGRSRETNIGGPLDMCFSYIACLQAAFCINAEKLGEPCGLNNKRISPPFEPMLQAQQAPYGVSNCDNSV